MALPHPSSALVDPAASLDVISNEWWGFLTSLYDRSPVTGTVTFAAATTAPVTFAVPELNTDYNVVIEAPEDRRVWVTAKTTTGFTLNVSAASSGTYGYTMMRR